VHEPPHHELAAFDPDTDHRLVKDRRRCEPAQLVLVERTRRSQDEPMKPERSSA
jgi:hypothetical protein